MNSYIPNDCEMQLGKPIRALRHQHACQKGVRAAKEEAHGR
jgi:hypothetical protein